MGALPPRTHFMTTTHFGFESVDEQDKARRVRSVFDSVAPKYDVMNDLMSMGLHRAWKAYTVMVANVKEGQQVTRGQKIAEMGNTDSDSVKLHFEIRKQGKPIDPMLYLPKR